MCVLNNLTNKLATKKFLIKSIHKEEEEEKKMTGDDCPTQGSRKRGLGWKRGVLRGVLRGEMLHLSPSTSSVSSFEKECKFRDYMKKQTLLIRHLSRCSTKQDKRTKFC